jgi:hypothetical protein
MYEFIEFIISYGEGLTPALIQEETRRTEVVFARQLIMYFSVKYKVASYETIAARTGGKDHATVNHALKSINNYLDTDKAKKGKIKYYEYLLEKAVPLAQRKLDVEKLIKPLKDELSELESRCLNLSVQLSFLKHSAKALEV